LSRRRPSSFIVEPGGSRFEGASRRKERTAVEASTVGQPADAKAFFGSDISEADPQLLEIVRREYTRQQNNIELIAPKNFASLATLQVRGTVLTNMISEGYPGQRYHGAMENVDAIEALAIDRAKQAFGCRFANIQPHSGSQANQVIYLAFLKPGDRILSMSLAAGGHLSHGAKPNLTGKWFDVLQYGVRREDCQIDYDEVEDLALKHQPKLIICGGSSYPRVLDFARFRSIADRSGALLLVDMAHFAGLVVAGQYPNPFPHVHFAVVTTNKTLRGPTGGIILYDDEAFSRKIDSALFPGLQGGPSVETLAAKAVALGEACRREFREYGRAVLENARALADTLATRGLTIVTGGTDTPLLLVDLRPSRLTGNIASASLEAAGLPCNMNMIPFDTEKPTVTSGLRFGVSAATARGLRRSDIVEVGNLVADVLEGLKVSRSENSAIEEQVKRRVKQLCDKFPIYATDCINRR
jgi:glycine hydroxymethyltransferase